METTPSQEAQPGGVKETAKSEAKAVADHVRGRARESSAKARQKAESSFVEQRSKLSRDAGGLADALRETAERLDAREQRELSTYLRSGAKVIDRAAQSIETQDFDGFLGSVDRVARKEPLVLFAGAAMASFVASIALRSAREE